MATSEDTARNAVASLVAEALKLGAVSASARCAYHRIIPELLHHVNRAMSDDPHIDTLLGDNTLAVMTDHLRRHADFMDTVLRINRYALLARVVPWEYRATVGHGFLPAYFPVAWKRWKAAVAFHLTGDAADEIIAVYDWMIDRHDRFLLASTVPVRPVGAVPAKWRETAGAFYAALIDNRVNEAMALAHQSVSGPDDLNAFYRRVVQPSLYRLGDQWAVGALSIAEEHLGTTISNRIMGSFYPMIFNTPKTRGSAIVCTPANERHETGGRMVADALTLSGWETFFLGANTPADSVLGLMESTAADLLAISVVMPANLGPLIDLIHGMHSRKDLHSTKVLVGGWVFSVLPDLWMMVSADGCAEDGPAAARLAARWWEARQ